MALWMIFALSVSLVVSFILAVVRGLRTKNFLGLVVQTLLIIGFTVFLNILFGFPFPSAAVAKSPSSDLAVATALFVSMILGMLAQFLYSHFTLRKGERKDFDWGLFVAPLFASPIVFLPLLSALQNADVDLTHLTAPRLMVLLVAFQNGFFWKELFDKRRRETKPK